MIESYFNQVESRRAPRPPPTLAWALPSLADLLLSLGFGRPMSLSPWSVVRGPVVSGQSRPALQSRLISSGLDQSRVICDPPLNFCFPLSTFCFPLLRRSQAKNQAKSRQIKPNQATTQQYVTGITTPLFGLRSVVSGQWSVVPSSRPPVVSGPRSSVLGPWSRGLPSPFRPPRGSEQFGPNMSNYEKNLRPPMNRSLRNPQSDIRNPRAFPTPNSPFPISPGPSSPRGSQAKNQAKSSEINPNQGTTQQMVPNSALSIPHSPFHESALIC